MGRASPDAHPTIYSAYSLKEFQRSRTRDLQNVVRDSASRFQNETSELDAALLDDENDARGSPLFELFDLEFGDFYDFIIIVHDGLLVLWCGY